MMLELVFWGSVALILYAYLGYPCALMALALVRNRPVKTGPVTAPVSFIITAHNEAARIREKIENTLTQDYPRDRLEIIVASDCSSDGTDEIVNEYRRRVRLVRAPARGGKEAAQQLAIEAATGEILVFSDAATTLAPDGVSNIVRNFADSSVGCVSSIDRFLDRDGRISGEGAYVRYEMFLRSLETRVNSLVGLSGSLFAARRQVCRPWAADRQSDFATLLQAVRRDLRGVLDPASAGYYSNIMDDRHEFHRKVRTVVRGIVVLAGNARLLNPLRYGLFAWQLASHKLCRWLVPWAMAAAALSNVLLVTHSRLYLATFLLQLGFYVAAAGGHWTGLRILKLPTFVVVANLAVLVAWFRYACGERFTIWSPSQRTKALPQPTLR